MIFREISADDFAKFVSSCPTSSFIQSSEMLSRYQKQGREHYLVGVTDDSGKRLILAALAVKIYQRSNKKIFSAPLGPLTDYTAPNVAQVLSFFTKEVKKFLRQKGGIVFQISPNIVARERDSDNNLVKNGENNLGVSRILQRAGYKYLGEYEQAKWTYVLDLKPFTKTRETKLLMHFRQTCRLSIKYATERYHLKVRALKKSELPLFKQLVDQAGNYHGFSSHSLEYYEQMYASFGKNVKFLVAETTGKTPLVRPDLEGSPSPGTPVAAAMFILNGSEIIYLSSGSDRKYTKYCGSHLLQWYILRFALKNGYKKYNFWGTQPDYEPGVYRFKKGFRGQMEELLGSFALPLDILGRIYLLRIKKAETRVLE